MPFTMKVHERDPQEPHIIKKRTPYVRVHTKNELPLFIQKGRFYYEDGTQVTSPPEWAVEMADNLSEKVKKEVGYEGVKRGPGRPPKNKDVSDGNDQPAGNVGQ